MLLPCMAFSLSCLLQLYKHYQYLVYFPVIWSSCCRGGAAQGWNKVTTNAIVTCGTTATTIWYVCVATTPARHHVRSVCGAAAPTRYHLGNSDPCSVSSSASHGSRLVPEGNAGISLRDGTHRTPWNCYQLRYHFKTTSDTNHDCGCMSLVHQCHELSVFIALICSIWPLHMSAGVAAGSLGIARPRHHVPPTSHGSYWHQYDHQGTLSRKLPPPYAGNIMYHGLQLAKLHHRVGAQALIGKTKKFWISTHQILARHNSTDKIIKNESWKNIPT